MLVAILGMVLCVQTAEFPSYDQAYAQAERERRPLLVVVTASWCAPCQVMKRDTIIPMRDGREFKEAVVTIVDKDAQPELAKQLMRGEELPQTIVFCKQQSEWKRFTLVGLLSRSRVGELLKRAVGR